MIPDLQTMRDNDARNTAVHEAGHAVMARALGSGHVEAWITPTGTTAHLFEKAWIGQCRFRDDDLAALAKRKIGIAGWAAEASLRDPDGLFVFDELTDPDAMSPSDWSGIGIDPGDVTLRIADLGARIVERMRGTLRTRLLAEARRILDDADQHHVTLPA